MYALHALPCVVCASRGQKGQRKRAGRQGTPFRRFRSLPPHPYTMACLCQRLVHPPHDLPARSSYPSISKPSTSLVCFCTPTPPFLETHSVFGRPRDSPVRVPPSLVLLFETGNQSPRRTRHVKAVQDAEPKTLGSQARQACTKGAGAAAGAGGAEAAPGS